MTITIAVASDKEARLQQAAERAGLPVEEFVAQIIDERLAQSSKVEPDEIIARYEQRELTHGQAAALLGITRAAFLEELGRRGVSPFQYDAAEVLAEAGL